MAITLEVFRKRAMSIIGPKGSPHGIICVNEALLRSTIIIHTTKGRTIRVVPLWVEAYYSGVIGKTKKNPCRCELCQYGGPMRQDLYFFKYLWDRSVDIVLSTEPETAYSILLKACSVDGTPMKQVKTAKTLWNSLSESGIRAIEIEDNTYHGDILITRRVLPQANSYSPAENDALYAAARINTWLRKRFGNLVSKGTAIHETDSNKVYRGLKLD